MSIYFPSKHHDDASLMMHDLTIFFKFGKNGYAVLRYGPRLGQNEAYRCQGYFFNGIRTSRMRNLNQTKGIWILSRIAFCLGRANASKGADQKGGLSSARRDPTTFSMQVLQHCTRMQVGASPSECGFCNTAFATPPRQYSVCSLCNTAKGTVTWEAVPSGVS